MRLIDADALIEFIDVGHFRPPTEICFSELDVKNLVDKQPTIEPKNGTWVYGEDEFGADGYYCDKCGFFVPFDYARQFISYMDDYYYCPHCGALMENDEEG